LCEHFAYRAIVLLKVAGRLGFGAQQLLHQLRLFLESFHADGQAILDTRVFIDGAVENIHLEFVAREQDPRRTDRRHLDRVANQPLKVPALLSTRNRCQILIWIEATQADHLFRRGVLAAAYGGRSQDFPLEILYRAIFRTAHQPKYRPAKADGNHAQGRAALDRSDGAADGTSPGQLASNPSTSRRIRRHLNQQGFQSLLLEKLSFPSDKKLNGGNSAARIAEGHLLQGCLRLSECLPCRREQDTDPYQKNKEASS